MKGEWPLSIAPNQAGLGVIILLTHCIINHKNQNWHVRQRAKVSLKARVSVLLTPPSTSRLPGLWDQNITPALKSFLSPSRASPGCFPPILQRPTFCGGQDESQVTQHHRCLFPPSIITQNNTSYGNDAACGCQHTTTRGLSPVPGLNQTYTWTPRALRCPWHCDGH